MAALSTGYGLFKYRTGNVGDEIQSIAARRFLPRVDQLLDRDRLSQFEPFEAFNELKVITNGWYTHEPQNWPPRSPRLNPLLISMHIAPTEPNVLKSFLSSDSKEFLIKHGPVGARDLATRDLLLENNVPSYFSGCMTLTLEARPDVPKNNFILLVDVPPAVEAEVRMRTERPIVKFPAHIDPRWSSEAKFKLAEYYLYLYQSAHAVITTRLHATLPSLALGTPVAFIQHEFTRGLSRFRGLLDLARVIPEEEFLTNPSLFDVNDPAPNSDDYLSVRQGLVSRCEEFTGQPAGQDQHFATEISTLLTDPDFMMMIGSAIHDFDRLQDRRVRRFADELDKLKVVRRRLRRSSQMQ